MRVHLYNLISGVIAAGYIVAAVFFLRFWRTTRDRLFVMFAIAFAILGVQRIAAVLAMQWTENTTWLYAMRLAAFLVILAAIIDKNRSTAADG